MVDRYKIAKLAPAKGKAKVVRSTRRKPEAALRPKSINNHLAILGRALRIAYKWRLIERVPEIEILRVGKQPFYFLSFEETDLFLAAARSTSRVGMPMRWSHSALGCVPGRCWHCIGRITSGSPSVS